MFRPRTDPLEPSRLQWIAGDQESLFRETPKLQELRNRLLTVGGEAVVLPRIEDDLLSILKRGQEFSGRWSLLRRGEPSRCHANVAALWESSNGFVRICTGYALSRDGVWRQHSWGLTAGGKVLETTERRVRYYGFVLRKKEAERFSYENYL